MDSKKIAEYSKISEDCYYYFDGKIIPANDACISVRDLTFTRGYGAFESLRTYQGMPFLLKQHILRLFQTARILRLKHNWGFEEISAAVNCALKANTPGDKLIRIYLTGGEGQGVVQTGKAKLLICIDPFKPFPEEQYTKGVKLFPYMHTRATWEAKSTNYCEAVLATAIARLKGYDEAVYVDDEGNLSEGTTFNLLCYSQSQWIVPKDGVLFGITAKLICNFLKKFGDTILHRKISRDDLPSSELYITSSNREVIPVCMIKNIFRADLRKYKRYNDLRKAYKNAVTYALKSNR